MQIHELNTFSGTVGDNDYFVTDNGTDTSKINASAIKDYVTPEMYGAVGDGVVDDTQALVNCANSGKDVRIDNSYYITDVAEFSNVSVYGHGTIKIKANNESTLQSRLRFNSCYVKNIRFVSENIYPSTWLDSGLYSNTYILSGNTLFENCYFEALEDIRSQDCDFIVVKNCEFKDCANGVLGTNSFRNYIEDCYFDILNYGGAYAHSIYLGGACYFNYITNCVFENCQHYPIHTYNSSQYNNGYLTYVQNCRVRNCRNGIASNSTLTIIDNCDVAATEFALFINGDANIKNCVMSCDRFLLCTSSNRTFNVSGSIITLRTFTSPGYVYSWKIYSNGNRWIQTGAQSSFILYVASTYTPLFFMQNDAFEGWDSSSGLFSMSAGTVKVFGCYIGEATLVIWLRTNTLKGYFIGNVHEASALATGTLKIDQYNTSIKGL